MGAYENEHPSQLPKAGTIADGLTTDVNWWNSDSTLSAIWNTFTDNAALTYEFAIGTSTSALADVVDWTSNSADTSVTKTGLSLTDGSTYYVSVRATDTDSQISDTTTTDGVTIDITAPVIFSVYEGSGGFTQNNYSLSFDGEFDYVSLGGSNVSRPSTAEMAIGSS